MDASDSFVRHVDHLLARVESLQQAVAQLYIELQACRERCRIPVAEFLEGEANLDEVAMPALPVAKAYYALRPVDRRESPRRQANRVLIVVISALDDSKPFSGWILDYSPVGLGLFVEKKIPIGTFLQIQPDPSSGHTFSQEAQVKNCQRHLDGWRLGCKLEKELSQEDLQQFGLE